MAFFAQSHPAICGDPNLSPSEARELTGLVSAYMRVLEGTETEARIAALEKQGTPSS
jgi:hypothetical protein